MREYEQATATTGEFAKMGAGGYVLAIQAVRLSGTDFNGKKIDYVTEKQYVKFIYDVIEGEFAGRFSDDYWAGEDKDYGHRVYFSWKNMGAFKNFIQCLDESNPGFDALAAFDADNWALFIGKKFGAVFGEEEYRKNNGELDTKLGFPNIKSVQAIHEGKFRIPALKKLKDEKPDGYYSTQAPAPGGNAASVYDDDIPFM